MSDAWGTSFESQQDQKLIDIRALSAGSYVYRVTQDGNIVGSGNFTVGGR